MAQPQTASIILAAASATAVAAAQSPGGAGNLTINGGSASGGIATLDVARRVLVTCAGNETGKTLIITGTDRYKNAIRETVALVNATTASTLQDFLTVTVATISAASAGNVSVGTSVVASTRWLRTNINCTPFSVGLAVNFGAATANATVEGTLDPVDASLLASAPNNSGSGDNTAAGLGNSTYVIPTPYPVQDMAAIAVDNVQQVATPVMAFRLTVNSGATTAGLRFTQIQTGVV